VKHIREHEVGGVRVPTPHARTLKHLVAPWTGGSERVWLGMTNIDPRSSSNQHGHPEKEEIFYVVSGRGEIAVGLERQAIEAGSIVVIPPGTPHQLFNDSDETLKVLSVVSPAFEASEFNLQHSITGT